MLRYWRGDRLVICELALCFPLCGNGCGWTEATRLAKRGKVTVTVNMLDDILMITRNAPMSKNSPLVDYALKGLERCWLPEHGRWSHIYHLEKHDKPNESVPHSDVF